MKKLFFVALSLIMINSFVQAQKKTFLRLYGVAGNKFNKGVFAGATDSSIFIYKDSNKVEIPISRIGTIKTRRSSGHTILISASTGAVLLGILGVASGESKVNDGTIGGALHNAFTVTPSEGLAQGLIIGGVLGTATGTIINIFRKKIHFTINGNRQTWLLQKNLIEQLPSSR